VTDVARRAAEVENGTPSQRDASALFGQIERAIAVSIGVLLSLTAILALTGAVLLAWDGAIQWPHTRSLFGIVDRLLFVLMLVEILHTVRASIRTHELACEPFLIVGMIATIRRILVLTLEMSDKSPTGEAALTFEHAMIELGVLGGLTLVLAFAIYLSRRSSGNFAQADQQ
jgi:uncharacterized membrane protein (DUF373 family)